MDQTQAPAKNHPFPKDRNYAIRWARRVFETDKRVLFLDSETTGLKTPEMVELAVADREGTHLLETLLMPEKPERVFETGKGGKCAADFHGITPDILREANAPDFVEIHPRLCELLEGVVLIIYNKKYDWTDIIEPTCARLGLELPKVEIVTCAMLEYAKYVGDWDDYHQSYTYPKLPSTEGVTAHRAMGDVLSTIALCRRMADETI